MKAESAWHYGGDLKAALVSAARAIVERDGPEALTLRGVAAATGVSAMAPYHHFKDRAALVAAVAAEGFAQLYSEKMAALSTAPGDPARRIVAGSIAYVRFAAEHPALYRLMKSPALADRAAHPELARAAARPGESLAAMLAELAAAGRLRGTDPAQAGQIIWALVHGIATLANDAYLADVETLAADGAAALLAGWGAL